MSSPTTPTEAEPAAPVDPPGFAGPSPATGLVDRVVDRLGDLADRLGTSVPSLLVGTVVVVAAAVVGWLALVRPDAPAPELAIPYAPTTGLGAAATGSAPASAPPTAPVVPAEVLVHAAGAVRHPGVYSLSPQARVSDLLAAAGGPLPEADLDRVNLAAPLTDGSRVYVPSEGEDQPPPVWAGDLPLPAAGGSGSAEAGRTLDVNTATAAELQGLPGVGPATAAAIVEHRQRHGPFAHVDDLIEVRGIGEAKLAALRDHVHV